MVLLSGLLRMDALTGRAGRWGIFFAGIAAMLAGVSVEGADMTPAEVAGGYDKQVRPLLGKYCYGCHSAEKHKGSLDLERFKTVALVRKDVKPWQMMIEMIEAGEMPPKDKPQPTAAEAKQLVLWVHDFLDSEARARAGDPGRVPVRRLSNAEYDYTIRDLAGVDLRPAREFPADGAAGEGFTNAAEALSDISPTLFNKYPAFGEGDRGACGAVAGWVSFFAEQDAARLVGRRAHETAGVLRAVYG